MEGKLYKWIGYMNGWKLRTVKLNGGILSFYEDDNTSTPEQRVHLAVATIDDDNENQLKFKINTGQVMCYLQTMTNEDKTKWLNAIKIAKIEADKQIRQGAAISNTAVGIQNLISNLCLWVSMSLNIKLRLSMVRLQLLSQIRMRLDMYFRLGWTTY